MELSISIPEIFSTSHTHSFFHFQISWMKFSLPRSCLVISRSLISFFSTTTCVAIPAWSQPGFHSVVSPLILCLHHHTKAIPLHIITFDAWCHSSLLNCNLWYWAYALLTIICLSIFLLLQWEKKIFDPLLILYVCPLTKKWSVYNFNGRFILTVRNRITTKKSRKTHFKNVINWFAF